MAAALRMTMQAKKVPSCLTSIDWGACISVILQQKIARQKSLDQLKRKDHT